MLSESLKAELRELINSTWNGIELRKWARRFGVAPHFVKHGKVGNLHKQTVIERMLEYIELNPAKENAKCQELRALVAEFKGEPGSPAETPAETPEPQEAPEPEKTPEKPRKRVSGTPGPAFLQDLAAWVQDIAGHAVCADDVRGIIAEELEKRPEAPATKVELVKPDGDVVVLGHSHKMLPDLLTAVQCGLFPYMVGPAGSGKSYAASQVAEALDRSFHFQGACLVRYDLLGFVDSQGRAVETPFSWAYRHGGLCLLDEVDAYSNEAATALLGALANGAMEQPGNPNPVERHERFICIAAGNGLPYGASAQYSGRNRLDGAFFDRFYPIIEWPYDESLERAIVSDPDAVGEVQKLRHKAESNGLQAIISPRASIAVAKLKAAGWSQEKAINGCVLNRIPEADRRTLGGV